MLTFHHFEFEEAIRENLGLTNDPINETDLLAVTTLDCSNFDFVSEDIDILTKCRRLKSLDINIGVEDLSFLSSFSDLEELYLVTWNYKNAVNFLYFSNLKNLTYLYVSGGEISSMSLVNMEELISLRNLRSLSLHEFGSVDLQFLEQMPWLELFFCGYANEVRNVSSISKLIHLKDLKLVDIEMDSLSFLDNMPNSMELELCGDEVKEGIDAEKLRRFKHVDVCEMTVGRMPIGLTIKT